MQNLAGTVPLLEGDYAWVYCFMEGCFESMAFRVGFLKGFYTIFNPAVGDVRAKSE